MSVSTATWLSGSSLSIESKMASLIWSAILSGWPSVTDSEVNNRRATLLISIQKEPADHVKCSRTNERPGPGRSAQPSGHQIPDEVRQRVLRAAGYRGDGAVGGERDRLVVGRAEAEAAADLVHDQDVAALPGQLGPGGGQVRVGLGGEADDHLAGRAVGRAARGQVGQDVGVLGQRDRLGQSAALFDLLPRTSGAACGASASIAACMSRAETARIIFAPTGSGSSTLAATTVTAAPRATA